MSIPRNDQQSTNDDSGDLAGIRREAEMLRANQQHDVERFRAALSAEIAEIQAELAAVLPAEPATPDRTATEPPPSARSRRTLLGWGALGAAASLAAAGGMALTSPAAHAADGDPLLLDQSNSASSSTALDFDGALVFRVTAGGTDNTTIFGTTGGGTTATTSGVAGSGGTDGKGVRGTANGRTAFGVWGASASGYGVVGESDTGIDLAAAGAGRLLQAPSGSAGEPASGAHSAGEQMRDAFGNLYLCVTSGSPGVWRKVIGVPVGYRNGTISFLATPIRVYDSRLSNNPLVGNGQRNVQVTGINIGGVQVPIGATGCIGNLTVVRPTTSGYLVIYPQGGRTPSSSAVNFVALQTIPNSFWVGLSGSGQVTVHAFQSGNCQFIVDIAGFIS